MKFSFLTTELKAAMAVACKAVSPKNALPILSTVMLTQNDEGDLVITGASQENRLSVTCPIADVEDFTPVCIDAALLNNAISNLGAQAVTLEVDKLSATLTYDKGHFSFAVESTADYPTPPALSDDAQVLTIPANTLLHLVKVCKPFTANDELRPVMNGICMDLTGDYLVAAASDGHKLIRHRYPEVKAGTGQMVIVSQPTAALLALLPKDSEVAVTITGNQAIFDAKGFRLMATLIEGRYPNYNSVIPTNQPYKIEVNRADLMAAIRRVSVMANQGSGLLRIATKRDLMGSVLTISAENADYATSGYEQIPYEGTLPDTFAIGFKGAFLLALLATYVGDRIQIALADQSRPGVFTEIDGDDRLLTLLMPMMLQDN